MPVPTPDPLLAIIERQQAGSLALRPAPGFEPRREQALTRAIAPWQHVPQQVRNIIQNPSYGTPVTHYRASRSAGGTNWLSEAPGQDMTGVEFTLVAYTPELRCILCKQQKMPIQDKGGVYYTVTQPIVIVPNPGIIYSVDPVLEPRLQDKFEIGDLTYYAASPATPCILGEAVAAYQITLIHERFPVNNAI
ncbi:MAG: hypothetical protein DDT26_00211 [Dehalococcoidia bacterium]|nr:hypothetical protein [Chloroflexota bacterium]